MTDAERQRRHREKIAFESGAIKAGISKLNRAQLRQHRAHRMERDLAEAIALAKSVYFDQPKRLEKELAKLLKMGAQFRRRPRDYHFLAFQRPEANKRSLRLGQLQQMFPERSAPPPNWETMRLPSFSLFMYLPTSMSWALRFAALADLGPSERAERHAKLSEGWLAAFDAAFIAQARRAAGRRSGSRSTLGSSMLKTSMILPLGTTGIRGELPKPM
jgi:hypothetical protein